MDWKAVFLLICFNIVTTNADILSCSAYTYPGNNSVNIKIAAILGFQSLEGGKCSGKYNEGSLKQAVFLKYAVNLLNGDGNSSNSFIPGVQFGIDFYDDCCSEYLAARHTGDIVSYIKGNDNCSGTTASIQNRPPIAGVIGTSISQTTTVVAEIMALTNVPVVGISATFPELSNKTKYPGFVRTVPSDLKLAQAIIELAQRFSWSYIIGVHTDDNYGVGGMAEVRRLAAEHMICMSSVKMLPISSDLEESQVENFIRTTVSNTMDKTNGSLGIVYFGNNKPLINLLEVVKRKRSLWGSTKYLNDLYWIATDSVSLTAELAQLIYDYQTSKIILLEPPDINISAFNEYYFKVFEDPPDWVTGQWKTAIKNIIINNFKCPSYNFTRDSLAGCNIRNLPTANSFMAATLDSVYLLANTLKQTYINVCPKDPQQLCPRFQEILQTGLSKITMKGFNYSEIDPLYRPQEFSDRYLSAVSQDFEAMGRLEFLYSIKVNTGRTTFSKIGNYKDGALDILDDYKTTIKPSMCKVQCSECVEMGHIDYLYSHGTHVLIGLFSIHWQSSTDRFGCGKYKTQSLNYMEIFAFISSVMYLRKTSGVKFGYLIIDDCSNTLRVTRTLSKIFSGELEIVDLETQEKFNRANSAVLIGAQSSTLTLAILPFLNGLGIPVISYSATNPTLIDPVRYPYFSRTVSSDLVQANAFIEILKSFKVTRAGAVVYKSVYGLDLYHQIRYLASGVGICIDDAFEMDEYTTVNEATEKIKTYRNSLIDVVLVLAVKVVVATLLDAVQYYDTFTFIASEAWGVDFDPSGDRGERARGSIILGLPEEYNVSYVLRERLSLMDPYANKNDWMRDFWQQYLKCNLPGSFNNIYGQYCPNKGSISEQNLTNLVTPLIVHAIIATMSAGLAIKSMVDSRASEPLNASKLTEEIRSLKFKYTNGSDFHPYLKSGDGSTGFYIYNLQQQGDKFVYEKVGDYSSTGVLSLSTSKVKFYNDNGNVVNTLSSSCYGRIECSMIPECSGNTLKSDPVSTTTQMSMVSISNTSNAVIALAVITGVFFLILVVLLLLILSWRRGWLKCIQRRYSDSKLKTPGLDSPIISPESGIDSQVELRPVLPPRAKSLPVQGSDNVVSDFSPGERSPSAVTYDVTSSQRSDSFNSGQPRTERAESVTSRQSEQTRYSGRRKRSQSSPINGDLASDTTRSPPCNYADIKILPRPHAPQQNPGKHASPATASSSTARRPKKPTQQVQPLANTPVSLPRGIGTYLHSNPNTPNQMSVFQPQMSTQYNPNLSILGLGISNNQPVVYISTQDGRMAAVPFIQTLNYSTSPPHQLSTTQPEEVINTQQVSGEYLVPVDPDYQLTLQPENEIGHISRNTIIGDFQIHQLPVNSETSSTPDRTITSGIPTNGMSPYQAQARGLNIPTYPSSSGQSKANNPPQSTAAVRPNTLAIHKSQPVKPTVPPNIAKQPMTASPRKTSPKLSLKHPDGAPSNIPLKPTEKLDVASTDLHAHVDETVTSGVVEVDDMVKMKARNISPTSNSMNQL